MDHPSINIRYEGKRGYYFSEAIKTLRTNIQFCGSNIKKIMVTSTFPDEGKSDISFAMATSLAQIGKKTILIDADIRNSIMAARYELPKKNNGLSQYLSGQVALDEVIYDTDLENFSVILAGPFSPNPAELLEESLFTRMLENLQEYYDYIIIDTPPMANLIDGAIVARHCDGAVLVIESGYVSYRLTQKVKNQLEKSGCRILGVVLNKVVNQGEAYYSRYGKYGKYGKYGRYGKYDRYSRYDKDGQQHEKEKSIESKG